ncbi:MAG: hypothetical protein HKN82_06595, partial [Akkermansiaceae bacterium]|nr:hypothetical protein [Akkermansiaceae bacterium]
HGDPTANDFERHENTLNRTRERPRATAQGAGLDDRYGEKLEKSRRSDPKGFYEEPDRRVPVEATRARNRDAFQAFAVTDLLRSGRNELRVRMIGEPVVGYAPSRPKGIAVDGLVTAADGEGHRIASGGPGWRTEWQGRGAELAVGSRAGQLPELRFVGEAMSRPNWKRWAGGAGVLVAAIVLICLWRGSFTVPVQWRSACAGFAATAFAGGLVRVAFFERSEHLWFRGAEWAAVVFSLALLAGMLTWWLAGRTRIGLRPRPGRAAPWILIGLLLLTFGLRAWRVAEQPIDDDEYASIQAVESIAATGVPEIGDGIWYSRSPLYHYAAGAVAAVFGTNLRALRLFSVAAAVGTAWLVWTMGRRYFGSRWIAGAATLLFALHPFLIFSGHIARFYQQQQFFVLLTLHLFLLGFVEAREVKWRLGAVLAFGAAVLSQEISVALVPVLAILYVLFGKSVPWRWEVRTILAVAVVAVVVAGDILLFQLKCLTRPTGVSPNVEATIAPTFWELGNMASMLVGYSRLHVVLSAFLPFSLWSAIRGGKRRLTALHVALGASVIVFNLLITSVSFRYQFALLPLWILLGCHGIWEAGRIAARWASHPAAGMVVRWAVLLAVVLSWSPWRIPGSYGEKILGDSTSALRHVKAHLRDDDRIMITEPHPHAAKMELGRVDYDLVVPVLYDFTYSDDGLLRDRNGDAEVINRLDRLQEVFAEQERVWVIVNREKFRSRKKNIRWEYPGAREELFLRENCTLVFRSYLWNVYLWDRDAGNLRAFRCQRGGWVE